MIEIRIAEDADFPGIGTLFGICFGREASVEELRWKYRQSPHGAVSYIAVDGGSIIAHYGAVCFRFVMNGMDLKAFQFCDVMSHPSYRAKVFGRSPLIVRMGERLYEENPMDFAFGFPSKRHARLQTIMLGGSEFRMVTAFRKPVRHVSPRRFRFHTIDDTPEAPESGSLDDLRKRAEPLQGLTIVRDAGYIRWRYRERPGVDYRFAVLKNRFTGTINGLAVFTVRERTSLVLDLEASSEKYRLFLMDHIHRVSAGTGADSIVLWANENEKEAVMLAREGFVKEEGVPCSVKIVNRKAIDESAFYDQYRWRLGDYDYY